MPTVTSLGDKGRGRIKLPEGYTNCTNKRIIFDRFFFFKPPVFEQWTHISLTMHACMHLMHLTMTHLFEDVIVVFVRVPGIGENKT